MAPREYARERAKALVPISSSLKSPKVADCLIAEIDRESIAGVTKSDTR